MKYYKLINDNKFIGIVCSDDFIRYSAIVDCFLRSSEEDGEYISFENKLYRTTWMSPIRMYQEHQKITTVEVDKEEYDAFMEAYRAGEEIEEDIDDEEGQEQEPEVNPYDYDTIDYIRTQKILSMSQACRRAIEEGFDLELRGETHHFSLTIQDQLNLMSLGATMQADSLIPYHADGEETVFYSVNEINQIIAAAQAHKDYQTTYYNSLKAYINSLDTIEAIAAITYGTPIPDEYKSDVLMVLE